MLGDQAVAQHCSCGESAEGVTADATAWSQRRHTWSLPARLTHYQRNDRLDLHRLVIDAHECPC
eukprot:scaffold21632_cov62-Phaeocystis_antarctica.AAC.6